MARWVVAPAVWICRTTGSTFAAKASAAARFEFRPDLRARFASIVSAFDADDFDGGDF